MGRDRARNDERSRIAHLAARLMAEDGIEDYALAKRKAARQAGMPDTRQLPTNDEIDEALRLHQLLYQPDEHRERLRALRLTAIDMMRQFARFQPYLTGSVLSGNAGKYADINLQLYTDDTKGVEVHLVDQRVPFRSGQMRVFAGTEAWLAPVYTLTADESEVQLVVLPERALRVPVRTHVDGKPMARAKLQAVENLVRDGDDELRPMPPASSLP